MQPTTTNSQDVINYHLLQIKTLPATNTQPARVKISSERFNQSKIIAFDNDPADAAPTTGTAIRYLQGNGFNIIGKGEGKDHNYLITDTFEPLKPIN